MATIMTKATFGLCWKNIIYVNTQGKMKGKS